MKIIKRLLRPDVIVIDADEADAVDWSKVDAGSIYLDIWGRIHLELNHRGYMPGLFNANMLDVFFRQGRHYARLPMLMLEACMTKPASDLMGALQFIYHRGQRFLLNSNVGVLSWDFMKGRGDPERNPGVGDIRRGAFAELLGWFDDMGRRLGAGIGYFTTATIPEEKMRKFGCHPYEVRGFGERLQRFMLTFPFKNTKVYVKSYGKETY